MRKRQLAICAAPQFLIAFEFSAMTICIVPIADDLGVAPGRIPLVYAAYSLAFGSLLLGGGRLSDQVGPSRCIGGGLALFGGGALGVAIAPTVPVLIACRVIEGAGAAVIAPAALALTTATFPEPERRRIAMSWYAAAISVGFVLGAIVAGAVGELLGWRPAIACVGLVALAALAGAGRPVARAGARGVGWRPDGVVLALATAAAVSASLGVALFSAGSLTPGLMGVTALAGIALAAAARRRGARRGGILVPSGTSLGAAFVPAVAGGATVTATGVAGTLLLSLYLQDVLSLSPMRVAVMFSVFGLGAFYGRLVATNLAARRGAPSVLAHGLAIQGVAIAALGAAAASAQQAVVLLFLTGVFGLGHVIANAGVALCATSGPPIWHGTAAGIVATAQYLAGAVGPACLLAAVASTVALPAGLAAAGVMSCLGGMLVAVSVDVR